MKRRRPRYLVLKLGLSLGVALASLEVALHIFPTLLPGSYRASFPLYGVGFFEPDLLDNTPVEDMPLPLYTVSRVGPPPSDLVELGLAPEAARARDLQKWGDIEIECDRMGLPNPTLRDRVDVVFVGDSFAVSAGVQKPAGLIKCFEQSSGLSTYNLGVAGIGAFQERNLLLTQGLPKHPKVVVWMFFGGNDLTDALITLYHKRQGHLTWGDVHADKRPPLLLLPAVLRFLRGRKIDARGVEPLRGLRLSNDAGSGAESQAEVWLFPNYLQALTRSREEWKADPAFDATLGVLAEVSQKTLAAGSKLLFVYLPSKAQVLLPLVESSAADVQAMAYFGKSVQALGPEEFLATARANGSALEDLMREACGTMGIPFLSATEGLREGARSGQIGFLEADTHWDAIGHGQLLGALLQAVRDLID